MRGFEPKSDRSDCIMLYMLTGQNMGNVMEEWLTVDQDATGNNATRDGEDGQGERREGDKPPDTSIQGNDEPLL